MTTREQAETFVIPGLKKLPNVSLTPQSVAMLMAIGLHESNLINRYSQPIDKLMHKGDSRGLWQFTKNMVDKVLSGTTKERALDLCRIYVGSLSTDAIWANLEWQDELACQFARLLLLRDPAALPAAIANNGVAAWDCYLRNWGGANTETRRKNFISIWEQVVTVANDLVPSQSKPAAPEVIKVDTTPSISISLTSNNTGNIGVSITATRRGLDVLHPSTKKKVEKLFELCQKEGLPVLIIDTLRTFEEQKALLNQNPPVTKCGPGQSPHNWGCAVDFCQNIKGKEYSDTSFFRKVGDLAKKVGLSWGGDFKSFVDPPHLEDPDFIINNKTDDLVKKFGTFEKFKATWSV